MSAYAQPPRLAALRVRARPSARVLTFTLLAALTAGSVILRTRILHTGYWVDEGISLGISSHPLGDLPALLRQDGAPPLYYTLLHFWIKLFGTSEEAVRSLSLLFAGLAVPAALASGWSLFGRRAGWIAAGGAAVSPFLGTYAQEARMYSLVVLLGIVCCAAFLHAFVYRRRRALPVFAISMALLLYTHAWGLFMLAATVLAVLVLCWRAPDRRKLTIDALIGYGTALALFAPWIPTLLFQARHTGAPWALKPDLAELLVGPGRLLGGPVPAIVLVAGIVVSAGAVIRAGGRRRAAALALLTLIVAVPLMAWAVSHVSPAWAWRYLAVTLGPLLLLASLAFSRLRRLDIAVLLIVGVWWATTGSPPVKSNARTVAAAFAASLRPGDWMISTQPEQLPALQHYLGATGERPATLTGPARHPDVVDWRDALPRMRNTTVERNLTPLLDHTPVGGRVLLVRPIVPNPVLWRAPWQAVVRIHSSRWLRAMLDDRRFRLIRAFPLDPVNPYPGPHPVRAQLFQKISP